MTTQKFQTDSQVEQQWQRIWLELEQSRQSVWNDSTRLEFEQRFATPINAAINEYLAASEQLDEVFDEIVKFIESLKKG